MSAPSRPARLFSSARFVGSIFRAKPRELLAAALGCLLALAPVRGALASHEPCVDGFAGEFPCQDVDMMARLTLPQIGGGSGSDIWGWTDPMTGREYAIMGRSTGTAFVDITNAEFPVYLGDLPTHTFASAWRDIKVYADHAFIVADNAGQHGMQVFHLPMLRNVTSPPVVFAEMAHYDGFGSAHNIVIDEETGFACAVGTATCGEGLHMMDLSEPHNPVFLGCFSDDGYTHDAQCVVYQGPDAEYQGHEICFAFNEDTLTIVDANDPANPVMLARAPYPGVGYSHQGWVTDDHQHLLLDDELDEIFFGGNTRTRIWDISDLDDPQMIGVHESGTTASDHNQYIHDGFAYQANYRGGLRILDIENIAQGMLSEVAYFDIYPANDNADTSGAWSVYPFFESGHVVVSGIGEGLFVLQPNVVQRPVFGSASEPAFADGAEGLGNANGFIEPGERVALTVEIRNTGNLGATGVAGVLSSLTPTAAIAQGANIASFPNLPVMGQGSNSSPFLVDVDPAHVCGEPILLQLSVISNEDENVVEIELPTGKLLPAATLFFEGFESGLPADWEAEGNWAVRPGADSAATPAEGQALASFEPGAAAFTDARLNTPEFPGGGVLSFRHAYRMEDSSARRPDERAEGAPVGPSPRHPVDAWDGLALEISTDGGETWQPLEDEIVAWSYTHFSLGTSVLEEGRPCWSGTSPSFPDDMHRVEVDLRAFAGQSVKVSFRYAEDSVIALDDQGWYIDEVRVAEPPAFACSTFVEETREGWVVR